MNLHGPVRAAESAGSGTAQVVISFDAWKEGQVAQSTHKVEVVRPKAAAKSEPVSSRLIRTLVHPDRKTSFSMVKFSADEKRLAVAGYPSGVLQIWDVEAGKELSRVETPPGLRGTADYIALTADWKTAFTSHDGRKVVRDEKDGQKRTTIDYAGEVRVWDVATGKPRPAVKLAPHRGASEAVVSPDGTRLVTIEARAYDPKDGAKFVPHAVVYRDLSGNNSPVELTTEFATVSFAPDGRTFAVTANNREKGSARLVLYDAGTGKEVAALGEEPKAAVYYPVYSPDGKRIAASVRSTADQKSVVKVWGTAGKGEAIVLSPAEPDTLLWHTFSPDGRFVTAPGRQGAGYVWDAATGKLVLTHTFGEKGFTRSVAVSPDGQRAAAVGIPGIDVSEFRRDPDPADLPQPRVVLYDLTTGKVVDTLVCPHGVPGLAAFSPGGRTLAVGSYGAVHLFDVK